MVERLSRLLQAMRGAWREEFGSLMQVREPEADVTEAQLLRVHTQKYLNTLNLQPLQQLKFLALRIWNG